MIVLRRSYYFLAVVALLIAIPAMAQLTGGPVTATQPIAPTINASLPDKTTPTLSPDALIFDGAINPAEYRLGPGDVLQYRSWTSNDAQQLMVSADEVLGIPRVGPFSTKGKTLQQVQQEITAKIQGNFKQSSSDRALFSLTVMQPRRIMVNILGQVETPGVYTLTGGTRTALAVSIANKPVTRTTILSDQQYQQEQERRKRAADRLKPYFGDPGDKNASMRNIVVTHSDGTSERVDLVGFNATHDPRFSPLLREGDVIYVPYKKILEGQVGVYGSVNSPGDYEFVPGDSLWMMIRASFGPSDGADLSKVEFTRMNAEGTQWTTEIIDCNAIRTGAKADIPLQPGDRIFIRNKPDQRELSRVIVKGEVQYPGVYPITRSSTKLSEVIKAAGGFTPEAFIAGSSVTRQKLDIDNKDITTEDERKIVGRVANLAVEDTAQFRFLTEVREGYVSVDMAALFEKGDASADITLRDGDVISVPVTPNSVYVWGYVGSVGYIPYRQGMSVNDYIRAAGGYAEGAVVEGTRIIKARTRKWAKPSETVVESGDEIYVPREKLYPDDYSLRQTATYVGIAGTIIGAIATIVTLVILTRNR